MASKSNGLEAFAPLLAAVATMQGNASRTEKTHAHEFLENFQKSVWSPTKSGFLLHADRSIILILLVYRLMLGQPHMPCYSRQMLLSRRSSLRRQH
jgi:hypothetical protein